MVWRRSFAKAGQRRRRKNYRIYKTRLNMAQGRRQIMRSSVPRVQSHRFKRNVKLLSLTTSNLGLAFNGYSFSLSDLPNYSEFLALYDMYKINYVVLRIIQRAYGLSMIEEVNNYSVGVPFMYYYVDRDDTTAPTTMDSIRENSSSKLHIFTPEKRCAYIKLKPSALRQVYRSAVSTSYEVAFNRWMDIADAGATPYYGVKLGIQVPNSGAAVGTNIHNFDVEATYYFSCKQPR